MLLMQRVFTLMVLASIGALLTMLLFPPIPRLRMHRIYPYASLSNWEMVPIPGHLAPPGGARY